MGLRSGFFAGHGRTLTFLSCRKTHIERAVWLEDHVRMSLQEGYHEENVFPETHSIEIAYNDHKLSPMML
jgi:hypothetical protein